MRWCYWWLDSSLLPHPGFSWLDPLFSVWRKWWWGPRPPALSRFVSHTSSSASVNVCVHVCVALKGKVNPFLCKQSHHTGQNTFQTPPPPHTQPPVCKVVWCGNSKEGGGLAAAQTEASEARWRKTCSTLIYLHCTHVMESLSAKAKCYILRVTVFTGSKQIKSFSGKWRGLVYHTSAQQNETSENRCQPITFLWMYHSKLRMNWITAVIPFQTFNALLTLSCLLTFNDGSNM